MRDLRTAALLGALALVAATSEAQPDLPTTPEVYRPYAVEEPAPGAVHAWGDAISVQWTTLDESLTGPVRVSVLCPGQAPYVRYASTANDGRAGFAIPASLGTHGSATDQESGCIAEVASAADPSTAAVSAPFVVLDPAAAVAAVTTRKLDISTPNNPARYGLADVLKWFWDPASVPAGDDVRLSVRCEDTDGAVTEWVRYPATENDGKASARLPASFGAHEACRAQVASTQTPTHVGRSAAFEVLAETLPSLDVTAPEPGATLPMGATVEIVWETEAVDATAAVRLVLRDLTGPEPNRHVGRTTNTGSLTWAVPTDLSTTSDYQLVVISEGTDGSRVTGRVAPLTFQASAHAAARAEATPEVLALGPPHPNPSRGQAAIWVGVPGAGPVEVAVFDALGRRVAVLASGERAAGWHAVPVEASSLAPGVYVVRAVAGGTVTTQTLTVAR